MGGVGAGGEGGVGGAEGVVHEHGDGHGADAAGDGGDGSSARLSAGEIDVAAEFVVIATIYTDVDDYCALFKPFALDGAAAADGGDDDVGGSAELGEVGAARVGDGGGAVGVEQELGYGFADDVGSADDEGGFALELDASALQQDHAAERGAGYVGWDR